MAHAEIHPDHEQIIVSTVFNEKDMIRQIPGAVWDADLKLWRMPLSWASCCILRGVFKDSLSVGASLGEWSINEYNRRVAPCTQMREMIAWEWEPDAIISLLRTF